MQKVRHGPTKRIGHNAIAAKPQSPSDQTPIVAALITGAISLVEAGVVL